jgi:hypothetical protein
MKLLVRDYVGTECISNYELVMVFMSEICALLLF